MKLSFSGILTLVALAGQVAQAQEAQPEEVPVGQQVEAAAGTPAAVQAAEEQRAEEIDELEPGVPAQVLVSDLRPQRATDGVMDELDLGRTEITGNQELPTVLYIVPWQKSDPGDLMGRPANTLLDEVLAPVDRGEFVRQVDYYSDLFDAKEEQ